MVTAVQRGRNAGIGQSVRATGVPPSTQQEGLSFRSGDGASQVPPSSNMAAVPARRCAGGTGARRGSGVGTSTSRPVAVASLVVVPVAASQQNVTFRGGVV